jgi:hypothetical protein
MDSKWTTKHIRELVQATQSIAESLQWLRAREEARGDTKTAPPVSSAPITKDAE